MPITITDNGVSSGARHLFYVLKDFARGKNWPECWPFLWRLAEETGRSVRMVRRYLRELEKCGSIQTIQKEGKGSRYRILLGVAERISKNVMDELRTPMSGVPMTPMSGVPMTPMSGVGDLLPYKRKQQAASSAVPEGPAAAAEEKSQEEEMQNRTKTAFDELVKLGMPANAEMEKRVNFDPDFAREALRHCKRRFGKGKKPVDNPGGYIAALLSNPEKFGFVRCDDRWHDPQTPSGPSAEDVAKGTAVKKAQSAALLAQCHADAEKTYALEKDVWERLPEAARQEIRDVVLKASPLFHGSGADAQEFELQCIKESARFKRENWRRKHLGIALLTGPTARMLE